MGSCISPKPFQRLIAIDAEKEKSCGVSIRRSTRNGQPILFINRGAAYWADGATAVFYGNLEGKLFAISAKNGPPVDDGTPPRLREGMVDAASTAARYG